MFALWLCELINNSIASIKHIPLQSITMDLHSKYIQYDGKRKIRIIWKTIHYIVAHCLILNSLPYFQTASLITKIGMLCQNLTVKNLFQNGDKLTILVRSGDRSLSFWQIPVNLNSVLLIRGTSGGQHESFEMFKTFVFLMRILFIPGFVHWKRVIFFFVTHPTCCILVVLTVFWLF